LACALSAQCRTVSDAMFRARAPAGLTCRRYSATSTRPCSTAQKPARARPPAPQPRGSADRRDTVRIEPREHGHRARRALREALARCAGRAERQRTRGKAEVVGRFGVALARLHQVLHAPPRTRVSRPSAPGAAGAPDSPCRGRAAAAGDARRGGGRRMGRDLGNRKVALAGRVVQRREALDVGAVELHVLARRGAPSARDARGARGARGSRGLTFSAMTLTHSILLERTAM